MRTAGCLGQSCVAVLHNTARRFAAGKKWECVRCLFKVLKERHGASAHLLSQAYLASV